MRNALILAAVLAAAAPAAAKVPVEKLAAELPSADLEGKVEIVQRLGRSRSPKAVPTLLSALDVKSGPPRLSLAIVQALGALGDPRAEESLTGAWDFLSGLRLSQGDDMPAPMTALRQGVAEALGRIGGERSAEILLQALSDSDPILVQKAVLGLGSLREKRAVDPLLDLLSRRGPVGRASYEALAEIGDPRAVPRLEAALKTGDPVLEAEGAYALARIRNEAADKLDLNSLMLNEALEPAGRILAAYYLARLGRDVGFEFLGKTLKAGAPFAQAQAAQALGQCGGARAAAALAEALKGADGPLKLSIVPELARTGEPKAASALKKLEQDKLLAVRQAAQMALAQMQE